MRFEGKVVIVTGGATGIGRATALAFAREGATVVVADVNERDGAQTLSMLRDLGNGAHFVRTDVSRKEDWDRLVEEVISRYGGIDVLFNNAGIEGASAPTADYPEESFDRVLAVNLKGVWLGMRAVIPKMVGQGRGTIVNNASILGVVGFAGAPAYTAAKHGILGLTKVAALEYAAAGIRVNAICPGFIKTPMVERGLAQMGDVQQLMAQMAQLHAVGRMGEPEEVASVVLFLASDAASFVTGAAYLADGGYTAR